MPAIGTGNRSARSERRVTRRKPAPAPARTPSFTRSPFHPAFQSQQRQAARAVSRARRRQPKAPIATPPIIPHPTRAQTREANRLITRSITRAVGPVGTGRDRLARRDALIRDVMTDPRYKRERAAIEHYTREALKLPEVRQAAARNAIDHVSAGRPPLKLEAAGLNVNLSSLAHTIASATSLGGASPENQFVKNALGDVKSLVTGPFVGGYEAGAGAWEAAHGRPQRLERLAKGIASSVKQEVTHPGKALVQHPLLFGLDVAGGVGAVGRVAGAAGRAAKIDRATVVRPPIALVEDAGAVRNGAFARRSYSKDLTRKAAQATADAAREPLRDAEGNVVTVMDRGHRVPVLKATGVERRHAAKKRADFTASRQVASERQAREVTTHDQAIRGVRGKTAKNLVAMAAEGTITTAEHFRTDLENRLKTIATKLDQHGRDVAAGKPSSVYRHAGEVRAAQKEAETIRHALASPRVMGQAGKIVAEGQRIGREQAAGDVKGSALGLGDAERMGRARLQVAAQAHMGAYHGRSRVLSQRVAQARRVERSLQARLNFGHSASEAERDRIASQLEKVRAMREAIQARNTERMRHPNGEPLELRHVEDFLRSRGRDPNTVAFLPHREDVVGNRAFHTQFRPDSRPTLTKGPVRTGALYAKGAQRTSAKLLHEQGVRQATQIAKAQHIDKFIAENGIRHPASAKAQRGERLTKGEQRIVRRGGLFTGKEAAEAAQRIYHDEGKDLVPVRAYPAKLDSETQRMIREDLQGPGAMDSLGQRLLNDRILKPEDLADSRARNVVLMDKTLIDRMNAHLRPAGQLERLLQWMNKPFRMAVLPQFRWLAGNFIEPYLVRLPTKGSGLVNIPGLAVDIAAAVKGLKAIERLPGGKEAADWIRAQQTGSGLFIGGRASVRRTVGDVLPESAQKAYGKAVAKMPVVEQAADMVKAGAHILAALPNAFFWVNRHLVERPAQLAAFGHHFREDVQAITKSWTKSVLLTSRAVEDAAKGLVGTPAQEAAMHAQYELLGKYAGQSPRMRALTQTVAPFLPWALNAARFVFWTMPAHNTVKTALLIKTQQVVAKDWQQIHSDVPPGGLKLAIPTKKGGWIDLARYTPYGMAGPIAEGDNLSSITNEFTPQLAGAINAINGRDPFGRDLKVKPSPSNPQGKASTWQTISIAANSLAESMIPYLAMGRRLREKGSTAYSNSTILSPKIKPGTSHGMSAARRTLDPFRPTYLRARGGQVVSQPSSVDASSGIPASVQQTLQSMQTSNAGPQIPASVQQTLARLAH